MYDSSLFSFLSQSWRMRSESMVRPVLSSMFHILVAFYSFHKFPEHMFPSGYVSFYNVPVQFCFLKQRTAETKIQLTLSYEILFHS